MADAAPMRPCSMNAEMVLGTLRGDKLQTRRPIVPQPEGSPHALRFDSLDWWPQYEDYRHGAPIRSPLGVPGDRLYVKEAIRWAPEHANYYYEADSKGVGAARYTYLRDRRLGSMEARVMPEEASRITLEVTEVRVQRVRDISEEDAKAEGIATVAFRPDEGFPVCEGFMVGADDGKTRLHAAASAAFRELWDSIYAAKGLGWTANPWVFVTTFKRE